MTKDEGYWLNVAYVVFAILGSYLGFKMFETVGIQTGWGEKYVQWYPTLSTVGGVLIGSVSVLLYVRKPGRKDHHILVLKELAKVTWPSYGDTKRMTWVVVVVVAIFSAILALFDLGWSWVLQQILT